MLATSQKIALDSLRSVGDWRLHITHIALEARCTWASKFSIRSPDDDWTQVIEYLEAKVVNIEIVHVDLEICYALNYQEFVTSRFPICNVELEDDTTL